jgi:hypothetical protein
MAHRRLPGPFPMAGKRTARCYHAQGPAWTALPPITLVIGWMITIMMRTTG